MRITTANLLKLVIVLAVMPSVADAQTAAIPRTSDGKPDLSGIWQVFSRANDNILAHSASEGVPAGLGVVVGDTLPYRPEALQQREQNYANRATLDTEANCYLPGVPRITYMPFPFQIIQFPETVTFLYEYVHATRYVYTNGSEHPEGPINWWLGDSRGHWDGDTLVVDVVHFTDTTWFDRTGNFHSEALHVVERYTPVDADHIQYEATIDDPAVYTEPWTMRMLLYRRTEPNFQLLEFDCYAFRWEQYYPYPSLNEGASR